MCRVARSDCKRALPVLARTVSPLNRRQLPRPPQRVTPLLPHALRAARTIAFGQAVALLLRVEGRALRIAQRSGAHAAPEPGETSAANAGSHAIQVCRARRRSPGQVRPLMLAVTPFRQLLLDVHLTALPVRREGGSREAERELR